MMNIDKRGIQMTDKIKLFIVERMDLHAISYHYKFSHIWLSIVMSRAINLDHFAF